MQINRQKKLVLFVILLCFLLVFRYANAQSVIYLPHNTGNQSSTITMAFPSGAVTPETAVEVVLQKAAASEPNKEWLINGTITIPIYCKLTLETGVTLLRDDCAITSPMVHLNGRYASIEGSNRNLILSECDDLTDGIIMVGSMNSSSNAVYYGCSVANLEISGDRGDVSDGMGGVVDDLSSHDNITGINIYKTPTGQNYNNTLEKLFISYVSTGIHFDECNATNVEDILLNRVGRDNQKALYFDGSDYNQISNVFHHNSVDANSIYLGSDGTEGSAFNSFRNYIIEIGAASTVGACIHIDNIEEVESNYFNVLCNHNFVVPTGTSPETYFNATTKNVLIGTEGLYYNDLKVLNDRLKYNSLLEICH